MRNKSVAVIFALTCAAATSAEPALARDQATAWDQLLAVRSACLAPPLPALAASETRMEGDAVVVDDPDFRLEWSLPEVAPAPIRSFLLQRSRLQVSAIATCLRAEARAGRWASPPERYKRTASWKAFDDRSGLQFWYLDDVDGAGPLGFYGGAFVWDVLEGRGLDFRDLLRPERISHFEGALCEALRRPLHARAGSQATCPNLDQVAITFSSMACWLPAPAGFKIVGVNAWHNVRDAKLSAYLPSAEFNDDLRPEFRSRFGRIEDCSPPI